MEARLDDRRQAEARQYAAQKRILFLVDAGVGAIYVLCLIATGAAIGLRQAVSGIPGGRFGEVAAFFVIILVAYTALTLPLSIIGWQLSRRHGLSVQRFGGWLADWAKGLVLSLVLGLLMVEVLYWLLAVTPAVWWVIAAALYLVFTVGLANLGPVLLVPLFFKMSPLDRPELVRGLQALAQRAGVHVGGVYCIELSSKTTAANAALMGLGKTRRIVIGDTLLNQYSPSEIEVVFAHELGHHVHHDVPKLVLLQTGLTFIGLFIAHEVLHWGVGAFGYQGIGDPATLPLLALFLGLYGFLTAPLSNWVSRQAERSADLYALRTTGDAPAFIDTMVKLANQNLAVVWPPRWEEVLFYDHPSIGERIAFGETFQRSTGAA